MMHRSLKILQSDPRRPDEARVFERPESNDEQQPQDPILFIGLLFGMVALILKVKISYSFFKASIFR